MVLWLNGEIVEGAAVDAMSAGVAIGWGVFTTIGIRQGSPRLLKRHFERLRRDAFEAQIELEATIEAIEAGLHQVLQLNGIKNGLARLTLTQRNDGRWNTQSGSDLSIAAVESEVSAAPMRVQLSPHRVEARRPLVGVKTTSYLPYFWAWREGKRSGFDEVILREGNEFLSEGARSNLFWVKNGELFTPSLETGCLRGLGRALVMEWSEAQSLRVVEGQFGGKALTEADEIWLVSAAAGPRSVFSWHDEHGLLLREFEAPEKMAANIRQWWNQLT